MCKTDEISKQQIKIMQNNQNICQIRKYEKKHMVQKPSGDVRICMDPRELNKYVQRERYILPTAETIFSELKGATVFSVFDASSAFWQVPLDKESTNLCTIATPFGRFRFKRLPYGLNSASEVFQRCINNILSGLQGTACYMDDILIYGSTMEEHNRNLETVLRRLEENNVKLNAKKQQIAVDKVNFLGHIVSRDGIAIQASRAEAIQKLKRPENKTEVQRFLGMKILPQQVKVQAFLDLKQGTAMDDNIQDHGRPTSENRRAYDPRSKEASHWVQVVGFDSSAVPSWRSGRPGDLWRWGAASR
ncbi:K02A2.6-like [Cordylochernes scorpioides]|uniref:K02A2.6-like n=1 Tax=Cordylochernes scorpioides TaxID=51811 RepID=A0ABY6KQK8_9ARAC|nr:K02A2.6-like [Cordylochernes scorpioides]